MTQTAQRPARRLWEHESGDVYAVIHTRIVGEGQWSTTYNLGVGGDRMTTLKEAVGAGFLEAESDDFNVGVWRSGKLVALLWMQEIVDNDPTFLGTVARDIGMPQ